MIWINDKYETEEHNVYKKDRYKDIRHGGTDDTVKQAV